MSWNYAIGHPRPKPIIVSQKYVHGEYVWKRVYFWKKILDTKYVSSSYELKSCILFIFVKENWGHQICLQLICVKTTDFVSTA